MSVKVNELKDVKIRKISMVDRGAARAPFKVMKRDGQKVQEVQKDTTGIKGAAMGLLDKVFKRQPVKVEPSVVAILVNKAEDVPVVEERMKAAGVELAEKTEVEGGVILSVAGYEASDDDLVMKFERPEFAAVIRGVQKGLLFPESTSLPAWSFADDFTSNGILPGIDAALDGLSCALWSAVYSADNPGDASSKIDSLLGEAATYLKALVSTIPATAYKMDKVVSKDSVDFKGGGVTDATGKFPMEPGGRQGKPYAAVDGDEQGVDPTKGGDVDGDDDEALKAIGGVHKGDGDQTGSAADGAGTDDKANKGGNNIPDGKQVAAQKGDDTSNKTADKAGFDIQGHPVQRETQKAADAPGGDKNFYRGTGARQSKDGEPVDASVDIDAPPKGGGQSPTGGSVIKDDLVEVLGPLLQPVVDSMNALVENQRSMQKAQGGLQAAFKGLQDNIEEVSGRVAKAEDTSRRVALTLKSTMQSHEGDTEVQQIHKSEVNGRTAEIGLIDTAYDRSLQQSD